MTLNAQDFETVNYELQAMCDRIDGLVTNINIALDRVPDLTAAMTELATYKANTDMAVSAVHDRLIARETAHHALVNQLQDILGQMQVKLNGALELKPEIMPYDQALAAGYLDTETGIKLRADATAQRKFTSQLLILRTAVEYAGAPTDMPVRLWDYNGNTHEIPFTAYVGLMLRFGMFVAQVEASF